MSSSTSIISLFTSVISSLEKDVTDLSSLASVRSALAPEQPAYNDDENSNPNATSQENSTLLKLSDVSNVLAELESRAEELVTMVEKEEEASEKLRRVLEESHKQRDELALMSNNLPKNMPHQRSGNTSTSASTTTTRASSTSAHASPPSSSSQSNQSNQSNIPPSLTYVTEEEYNSVPKVTVGRVTLSQLNSAVDAINEAASFKHAALYEKKGEKRGEKKYKSKAIQHLSVKCEEHGSSFWLAEPDLRETCAFFRAGESTAKTTLGLLRGFKRLKQVQGEGGVVTYVFL
jgi:hypothetical protein